MVRGGIRLKGVLRISRNMAIVRNGDELALVNPIRLDADGERDLRALGTVKHVVRLGAMHGKDDPYYVERAGAELWCQPGGSTYPEPAAGHALGADGALPFPDAELFCFEGAQQPEAAILLREGRACC